MIVVKNIKSVIIKSFTYIEESGQLSVDFLANFKKRETYVGITKQDFMLITSNEDTDGYYFNYLKNQKKMSEKKQLPKGINKSSKDKRYIRLRLDVTKINKDFLYVGEKGVYLDATLHMLPDGEVDNNENLGFITQDVPNALRKENSTLKGAILGNAKENYWEKQAQESSPGVDLPIASGDDNGIMDDLPF